VVRSYTATMGRSTGMKKPTQRGNRRGFGIVVVVATLLLAACTQSATVVTYQESIPDFRAYRSFDFAQPLSTDNGDARSILSTHLMTQTAHQLDARGFQRDRNQPDLIVDFNASTTNNIPASNQPQSSVAISRGGAWGPGYRGPAYWGPGYRYRGPGTRTSVGGGVSASGISVTTEGALVIRMIERERQRLVWEGTATERVTDKTMNNLEPVVETAVADIFAKFPAALIP
jgi:hypothetical protein